MYKNKILDEDESSIDDIFNGDEINIIEEFKGNADSTHLQNNSNNNINKKLINITFETSSGNSINLVVEKNATIREMINQYFLRMKISEKYKNLFLFIYGVSSIDINDISTLVEKGITDHKKIFVEEKNSGLKGNIKGKKLKVSIIDQNKLDSLTYIGTLNQIKELFIDLNNIYPGNMITKIFIEKKEYTKDDKQTFSSIGVRNDFNCYLNMNIKEEKESSKCIIF